MPVFLKLTFVNNEPVWLNMALVQKMITSGDGGTVMFFDERKQIVKESPDEIVQMLYSEDAEDDSENPSITLEKHSAQYGPCNPNQFIFEGGIDNEH